jgi:succinyl-CoA--D-citramalate CoA-transferase
MSGEKKSSAPLDGLRVIDLGHVLAGPFAATLLGDFGADVIKIERPGEGDPMRSMGPTSDDGPVWWKSMGRNKRSLALDWKHPKALPVLKELVRSSQVLIENFRPGVLERNGFGPEVLHEWNEDLVILRISGYGQTGPYASRPGFGKAAEAMSGLVHLTGFPDGPPVHPGFPMADMVTGLMGAYGVVLALLAIRRGLARGQVIDLPIYEAPMRLLDYHVAVRTGSEVVPMRNGNQQPMAFGLAGVFQSKDGRWITYSAATFAVARRVLNMVGGKTLLQDPRFTRLSAVCQHEREVNDLLASWMKERSTEEILQAFGQAQAVAAVVYDTDDILSDPHIAARQNIAEVAGERTKVVNVVPRLSQTPGAVRWLGRREIGTDSSAVLREVLNLGEAEISALFSAGAAKPAS